MDVPAFFRIFETHRLRFTDGFFATSGKWHGIFGKNSLHNQETHLYGRLSVDLLQIKRYTVYVEK